MKKINLILGSILALPIVSAQGIPVPDILTNIIRTIFSGNVEIAYMRLILFIGIFTIFYALLNGIGPFSKEATKRGGISVTLALVLAAIASFTMPENTVTLVFNLYSGLFGLILLLGPILYLIYFVYKHVPGDSKGGHFIRFLILLLLAAILLSPSLINSIDLLQRVGADEYLAFAGLILFILAIIELAKSFGSSGSGDAASKPSEPWGSGISNWFNKRKENLDNHIEKKRVESEKKQDEQVKKISELGENISKLNVNETNDLKALNQLINALDEVQDKDSFVKHETRLQMMPALKEAARKLKEIAERLNKTINQKYVLEDESQRAAAKLLSELEKEYTTLINDKSIDDDIKLELRRRFGELITKLRNDGNQNISLKDLNKKYRSLITELQTKIDQLIKTINNIEESSKKLNVPKYAIDKNEYRNIMDSLKVLRDEILGVFNTIKSYHKSLTPEELAKLEKEKNDLVREVDEAKTKINEDLKEVNDLHEKGKKAENVEEKEEILEAEKKAVKNIPEKSKARKAAEKIVIEDAKVLEETVNKQKNNLKLNQKEIKIIVDTIEKINVFELNPSNNTIKPIIINVNKLSTAKIKATLNTYIELVSSRMTIKDEVQRQSERIKKYLNSILDKQ